MNNNPQVIFRVVLRHILRGIDWNLLDLGLGLGLQLFIANVFLSACCHGDLVLG